MASIQSKVSKSGKRTYFVVVPVGEKRKWIKAGTQKDAKNLKKHLDSLEKSQQIEKLGITPNKTRIDEFFQRYIDYIKIHNATSTVKRYSGIINTFIVYLKMFYPGIKHLDQLKRVHIEEYQHQRLTSLELKKAADGEKVGNHLKPKLPKPRTVNNEVATLNIALRWALDHELIGNVPTKKVKKLKTPQVSPGKIMSEDQCQQFLSTAREMVKSGDLHDVYHKAFVFLLNTGLRAGELCNLTWNDVDLNSGLIKIQAKEGWNPKTYAREFFLNPVSLEILKSIPESYTNIFTRPNGLPLKTDHLRVALIRVTKKAGIENFTRVHDLRHTFNSLMQMKGVDPGTMGKILGHRDIETTMIYTHQTGKHLKDSIKKISLI